MFIGKIEDTFSIEGRGIAVVLDVGFEGLIKGWPLRQGDPIELRNPDATMITTRVVGIDSANSPTGILLSPEVTRDQIQRGAEVWKIN